MLRISAVSFFMQVKFWKRAKTLWRTEHMELSKSTMRSLRKIEFVFSIEGRTNLVVDSRCSSRKIHLLGRQK